MTDPSSNDTIFDQFLYIIDTAIEEGNPNILQRAIKEYTGKISQNYINMAINMYEQLVVEKIEDMEI
tara:strand:- start:249 stop:449 length:201 start_codon:yes stop_codon:yes gene_type:complete